MPWIEYEKISKINISYDIFYLSKGKCLHFLGKYKEAIEELSHDNRLNEVQSIII